MFFFLNHIQDCQSNKRCLYCQVLFVSVFRPCSIHLRAGSPSRFECSFKCFLFISGLRFIKKPLAKAKRDWSTSSYGCRHSVIAPVGQRRIHCPHRPLAKKMLTNGWLPCAHTCPIRASKWSDLTSGNLVQIVMHEFV